MLKDIAILRSLTRLRQLPSALSFCYLKSMALRLCTGNEALAYGALRAGVTVVSGYPGTPSTEVLETIAVQTRALGIAGLHIEWSTNEKVALEVGAGAAFAGARALVTMKQVGLNVASDALMTLPYLSVRGGLVLIVADDPGPISSQTEQDTRQFAAFAKVPILDPSNPEEALAMVPYAFDLSERFATPVIIRPTTRVCHGSTALDSTFEYVPQTIRGFERGPQWVIMPQRAFEGHRKILMRLAQVAEEFSTAEFTTITEVHSCAPVKSGVPVEAGAPVKAGVPARRGIIAGGISYAYVCDVLDILAHHELGQIDPTVAFPDLSCSQASRREPLRLGKIGTPFPFPKARALAFLEGLEAVLVVEELEPVIERELLQLVGAYRLPTQILGKLSGHTTQAGENSIDIIAQLVSDFCAMTLSESAQKVREGDATLHSLGQGLRAAVSIGPASAAFQFPEQGLKPAVVPTPPLEDVDLPSRPPVLCAGCPHRASFYAVKRALRGRKAIFSGDIGCYTLGNALPLDMVDSCVCMGAGFTVPQGMERAQPEIPHLGFLGDSTFFASGLTGVVNAVYNRSRVTFCVLDNSTTAMTGFQPHPGTGVSLGTLLAQNAPVDAHRQADASPQTDAGKQADTPTQIDAEHALRIPDILRALGVRQVTQVDPFDQTQAMCAVREAVNFDGPSAVIFKAPCITVVPPKPQPHLRGELCTNCKACIRAIGCPALVARKGRVALDETRCYGCALCVSLCPTGAIQPYETSRNHGA
ncbi:MAG: 4Fe-4S binding protein [Coriobacteriales bacterium]|nr:4Fe-4S binding protein [Coriobacteriales bacterium]